MESALKTAFPFIAYSVAILLAFQGVLMIVAYTVLGERKVLGWMQGRVGPNRVGPWGVLQPFADLLKFIFKEDIVPDKSTKFVYFLAPLVALTCALLPIVVYPFGPRIADPLGWLVPYVADIPYVGPATVWIAEQAMNMPLTIARIDVGVLFVLGITSVGVFGIALAGWSSNNKYSLMGGLRSSAQMISYELAMGASVIGVVMLAGSLDLNGIIEAQTKSTFKWFIIPQFIGFIVFLIAAFAETNRVPFDLPEAETELVAGFPSHTFSNLASEASRSCVPFARSCSADFCRVARASNSDLIRSASVFVPAMTCLLTTWCSTRTESLCNDQIRIRRPPGTLRSARAPLQARPAPGPLSPTNAPSRTSGP
jgi:NADH:ubiquinone oxidoreductase subunit H